MCVWGVFDQVLRALGFFPGQKLPFPAFSLGGSSGKGLRLTGCSTVGTLLAFWVWHQFVVPAVLHITGYLVFLVPKY